MKQRPLQVHILSWHLDHIKRPQHLRHKQPPLRPRHLSASTGSHAYAERKETFEVIFGKLGVVERMAWWEPALWSVVECVVEVLWTSCLGEDACLDSDLEMPKVSNGFLLGGSQQRREAGAVWVKGKLF
jgi:hypothetical protein